MTSTCPREQNTPRPLEKIAAEIDRLERANIVDIGDLLLEAKAQCEHGQWLEWLSCEFEWSVDTAGRYMAVAALCAKFRRLRNLKIPITILYELTIEDERDLPDIVEELAKHATTSRLKPSEARRLVTIGKNRRRFGDHPDATLSALDDLYSDHAQQPWCQKTVTALLEQEPETKESALAVIRAVRDDFEQATEIAAEDDDVPADVDPEKSPVVTGGGQTTSSPFIPWADRQTFSDAVSDLISISTKPIDRFVGGVSPDKLSAAIKFLKDVKNRMDGLAQRPAA